MNRLQLLRQTGTLSAVGVMAFLEALDDEDTDLRRHAALDTAQRESVITLPARGQPSNANANANANATSMTCGTERRTVMIGPDEHRVADEAIEAVSCEELLFQRKGRLVRIVVAVGGAIGGGTANPAPEIIEVDQVALRELLTKRVKFVATKPNGQIYEVPPPKQIVLAILARRVWPSQRALKGVVETPILRPDGFVLSSPGYDAATGLFFAPNRVFAAVKLEPDLSDARAARDSLLDVMSDFPFESERDCAAGLAAILGLLARHAYAGDTPVLAISGSTSGVGKSLLARFISRTSIGRDIPPTRLNPSASSLRKSGGAGATATASAGIVWLDNVPSSEATRAVESALTPEVAGHAVERQLWIVSGDNLQFERRDIARRVLPVRLRSADGLPDARTQFKYQDLLKVAEAHGPELTTAALTILRGYVVAGAPNVELAPLGGFEPWSDWVRAPIVWVGLPDPAFTSLHVEGPEDTSSRGLSALLSAWEHATDILGLHGLSAADAIRFAYELPAHGTRRDVSIALRDAIEEVCASRRLRPDAQQLGTALRGLRQRVVDGLMFDATTTQGLNRWKVVAVAAGGRGGRGGRGCGASTPTWR